MTGKNLNEIVQSGQALELNGTEPVQANPVSLPPPDRFDRWCNERDEKYLHARARQYVNPYVPGFYAAWWRGFRSVRVTVLCLVSQQRCLPAAGQHYP